MKNAQFVSLLLLLSSFDWSSADPDTEFAIDLYKTIGNKNYGKNLFFSPLSISMAFGLVHLGAGGDTKAQLKSALKFASSNSDESINNAFKQILATLKQQDNNYTVQVVNRLFGSNEFNIRKEFLDESREFFESTLESLDFKQKPEESRVHINDWVSEQTKGKIKELLTSGTIDSVTRLVIVNAVYFKAFWLFPFDSEKTKPGPFRISNSEAVQLDMMHMPNLKHLDYYDSQELNSEILELPYQGNKASMFIILPRDVEGLPRLEKLLTARTLLDELSKVRMQKVNVTFPKFTMDQSITLKQFLQPLGMTDVFDQHKSDLSRISGSRMHVSDSIHKAFVSVSESGTEAAAATAVVMLGSSPGEPIRFNVDRPFMFMIRAKNTNATLFLGRLVGSPKANELLGRFGESAGLTGGNAPPFPSASLTVCIWSALLVLCCLSVH